MILYTSLSPGHKNKDNQQNAIDSWEKCGFKRVSVNHPMEIMAMDKYTGIEFEEIEKTHVDKYGKLYAPINEIFRLGMAQTDPLICICNSDIILNIPKPTLQRIEKLMMESIIVLNRVDYKRKFDDGRFYLGGMDVFFIHQKYLNIYPETKFVLGQCHWDYWVPYRALKEGVKVTFLNNHLAFHKEHPLQYNGHSWKRTGREFMRVEGISLHEKVEEVSENAYNYIVGNSQRIFL